MKKTTALRQLLSREGSALVAGAHNGLSGRLVERAGFDAIWASGFEISASYAVPDANILTMAETLAASKGIADATKIPVIADCDNGYGNAINVMRTVTEYERAGIAGICIEDNIFPKRCSFYAGVRRELESVEEFAGKIRAGKSAQTDPDFVLIARTEALIAGWGMEEALKRARAYAAAGADAILIHSKSKSPDEVLQFAQTWTATPGAVPLVCVPTIYKNTSAGELGKAGFKVVIFANHAVRSAIRAMRETLVTLRREQRAAAVDDRVVSLEEVYDLVGVTDMKEGEDKFLPVGAAKVTAVIMAAGFERQLLPLIADRPKAMLDVKGRTILEREIATLNACSIKDIAVVRGYKRETIDLPNLRYHDNENFAESGELHSLFQAKSELKGRTVILYGDILFDRAVVERLLHSEADVTLVVDRAYAEYAAARDGAVSPPAELPRSRDLVVFDRAPDVGYRYLPSEELKGVRRIGEKIDPKEAHGEFVGLWMLSERGAAAVVEAYEKAAVQFRGKPFHEAASFERASLPDLIQHLIDAGVAVSAVEIYKGWMEIDTFEDYQRAWAQVRA